MFYNVKSIELIEGLGEGGWSEIEGTVAYS